MRCHYTSRIIAKMKEIDGGEGWQECGATEILVCCCWKCKITATLEDSLAMSYFYFYFILLKKSLFTLRERESKSERASECRQRETERERIPCRLRTIGEEPDVGLNTQTVRSRPGPKSRVRCLTKWATQAPLATSYKGKHILTQLYHPPTPLLGIYPREMWTYGHTKTYQNVHYSFIHNNQIITTCHQQVYR